MAQKGFSLIEVTMAAAVSSFIMLGIVSLISVQSQQVSYLEDRLSHQNLKSEIETLLSKSQSCTNSFEGLKIPTSLNSELNDNLQIKNNDDEVVFDTKQHNTFDQLLVKDISLQNIDMTNGSSSGKAKIKVDIQRKRRLGPDYMQSITKEVSVSLDTNRRVKSCSANDIAPCVEPFKMHGVTNSGDRTIVIPSDTKAVGFFIPFGSAPFSRRHYEVDTPGGRPANDTSLLAEVNIIMPVDGSLGPDIVAGKTLSYSGGVIRINGVQMTVRRRLATGYLSWTDSIFPLFDATGLCVRHTIENPGPRLLYDWVNVGQFNQKLARNWSGYSYNKWHVAWITFYK